MLDQVMANERKEGFRAKWAVNATTIIKVEWPRIITIQTRGRTRERVIDRAIKGGLGYCGKSALTECDGCVWIFFENDKGGVRINFKHMRGHQPPHLSAENTSNRTLLWLNIIALKQSGYLVF